MRTRCAVAQGRRSLGADAVFLVQAARRALPYGLYLVLRAGRQGGPQPARHVSRTEWGLLRLVRRTPCTHPVSMASPRPDGGFFARSEVDRCDENRSGTMRWHAMRRAEKRWHDIIGTRVGRAIFAREAPKLRVTRKKRQLVLLKWRRDLPPTILRSCGYWSVMQTINFRRGI